MERCAPPGPRSARVLSASPPPPEPQCAPRRCWPRWPCSQPAEPLSPPSPTAPSPSGAGARGSLSPRRAPTTRRRSTRRRRSRTNTWWGTWSEVSLRKGRGVEPVVKPKPAKRGSEKNAGKPRRRKNKGKNKKKGTPCEMEYKNFCIHGECVYLQHLQMATCKCYQDYFGERCGEQFMKTQRKNDVADYSKTVLVVVAVLLSSISFVAVLIIVIVQVRKKCPQYEEKEERKKLRQENRNSHVGV
ncbi:amphiregulin isoform X1 [Gallus gallus]|uniref:amphiregulin isoform X1 n=1 Tax=Gallus gallus TaxID=9031 RepID=UPI001AE9276E|nr:amphiregulin isoform X1 [Gallus gallus]